MKISIQLMVVLISCFVSKCNMGKDDHTNAKMPVMDSASMQKQDTLMMRMEGVFKHWLTDTIKKIDTGKQVIDQSNSINKRFKVAPDSLGLSIIKEYDLDISPGYKAKNEDLDRVLSLLKEYDEYPENNFRIKCTADYFYSPSPVPQLPYDLVYKINRLETLSLDGEKRTSYSVVRGSLSYKEIVLAGKNGNTVTKRINFILKDGKFEKVPLK